MPAEFVAVREITYQQLLLTEPYHRPDLNLAWRRVKGTQVRLMAEPDWLKDVGRPERNLD